jgi:hypothetical protein
MHLNISVTSPSTMKYNCFAWAAGESKNGEWWGPDLMYEGYWPSTVRREETLQAYIAAYETVDYEVCDSEYFEKGFEKIAIYVNNLGRPAHAARQLSNGEWTSKIGGWEDVKHEFSAYFIFELHGRSIDYGEIAVFMKRTLTM